LSEEVKTHKLNVRVKKYVKTRSSMFCRYELKSMKIGNANRYPAADPMSGSGLPRKNIKKDTNDGISIKNKRIVKE